MIVKMVFAVPLCSHDHAESVVFLLVDEFFTVITVFGLSVVVS